MQESFTVCMCDKIGVSVCTYNMCDSTCLHMCVCVCVCICACIRVCVCSVLPRYLKACRPDMPSFLPSFYRSVNLWAFRVFLGEQMMQMPKLKTKITSLSILHFNAMTS